MTKYCPRCRIENLDDALWCDNCNTKLLEKLEINEEIQRSEHSKPQVAIPSNYQVPYQSRKIVSKVSAIVFPIFLTFILIMIYFNNVTSDFAGINCKINEDFWFEGNSLFTSDGWTFTITKVRDYTLDGIILAINTYSKNDFPYRPINIFSPIDLVIGTDDVKNNPEAYSFTITSFRDRYAYWEFRSDSQENYNYFRSHTGNNHIIPHNEEVLSELATNLSENNIVFLEGSLVNLYGTRDNEYYTWNTDTTIGNFHCEIILLDNITISSSI
jgi:hypothetical protein